MKKLKLQLGICDDRRIQTGPSRRGTKEENLSMYTKKNRLVLLFLLLVLSAMLFGRETDIRNVQKGETGYGFSLDEIRERLECIYQLETMRKPYMSSQFG